MGIVSVSVVPALQQNTAASIGAAGDETARLLEFARARAVASGSPVGVGIDASSSVLVVQVLSDAGEIETFTDPVTLVEKQSDMPSLFPAASVTAFTNGDGSTSSGTIWFDYTGSPHTRDSDGTFDAAFSENALVTISGTRIVEVHAYTGMIEQR